jgi:hypothetical protein
MGVGLAIALLTAVVLRLMGRVWWCQVGDWSPWSGDIWSSHQSQHLVDPYLFTHVLHGVMFYAVLRFLGKERFQWQLLGAISLEAIWEIIENSPFIIERYRAVTISLDYFGDSVINSVMDIVACTTGFLIAARLPWKWSLAFFVATEVILTLWIRDSLVLNIIMLTVPIEAIRQWQMEIAPPLG